MKIKGVYFGGHLSYPASKQGNQVEIIGEKGKLIIKNIAIFKKWVFEIPLNKIIRKEITAGIQQIASTYETIVSVYAIGGLGLKDKADILTIPFKEGKIVQRVKLILKEKQRRELLNFILKK